MSNTEPIDNGNHEIDAKGAVSAAMALFRDLQVGDYTDVFLEGIDVPEAARDDWQVTIGFTPRKGHEGLQGAVKEALLVPRPTRGHWRLRTTITLDKTGKLKRMSPSTPYAPV